MPTIKLSFDTSITNLGTDIELFTKIDKDGTSLEINCPVNGTHEFILDDDGSSYEVEIQMRGKSDADTVMVGDTVIESAEIEFDNFKFDDFCFDDIVPMIATYKHNFNGYGEEHTGPFEMVMGCNGEVTFTFTTPLYKWLLENAD